METYRKILIQVFSLREKSITTPESSVLAKNTAETVVARLTDQEVVGIYLGLEAHNMILLDEFVRSNLV